MLLNAANPPCLFSVVSLNMHCRCTEQGNFFFLFTTFIPAILCPWMHGTVKFLYLVHSGKETTARKLLSNLSIVEDLDISWPTKSEEGAA